MLLSPLGKTEIEPDAIAIESKPEHLMWISLVSIYETGERLHFDSAIFQATCVDSTVIPFVTQNLNSTLGCYGCRESTDIKDEENLGGIPYSNLADLIKNLNKLVEKPIERAISKADYNSFSGCGQ